MLIISNKIYRVLVQQLGEVYLSGLRIACGLVSLENYAEIS